MQNDIRLTPHFMLSEFVKSSTASAQKIDNTPSKEVMGNLKTLCEQVLEPLRQHFGVPIEINSGYRCPALNRAVGGAVNSQHMTGEAADIHIPVHDFVDSNGHHHSNMNILKKWFTWIMDNCDFDQLIKETTNRRTYWIHVSCKRDRSKNRHQVITFMLKSS